MVNPPAAARANLAAIRIGAEVRGLLHILISVFEVV